MYTRTPENQALFQKAISQQLKAELAVSDMPNDAIAEHLNIHRSTLYKYVRGESSIPVDFVYAFCRVVGIKPEWFFRRIVERMGALTYTQNATTS